MAEYRVTISDWLPCSTNKTIGVRWQVKNRLKEADSRRIQAEFDYAGVPPVRITKFQRKLRKTLAMALKQPDDPTPIRRRVQLEVTFGKGVRQRDPDNFVKGLLDGLKRACMLYDDSLTWCEMVLPPLYAKGERTETTIILTDIPAYTMPRAANQTARSRA